MANEIQDCLDGRPGAWARFVRQHGPGIYSAVRRVLAGRVREDLDALCQDVVQEVMLRLVKDDYALLRRFDPRRASPATWLAVVSRSSAIDALRRRALPTVALDRQVDTLAAPPAVPDGEQAPSLDLPAGLLTPRQALVLHLLFDRQLDVAEAARTLGVDGQTIRSTRHKALARLREHFGLAAGH